MTPDTCAVLFDYGGTLDSDGLHWQERFRSLYREEGLRVGDEAFAKAFYDADDNLPSRFDLRGLDLDRTVRLQAGSVLKALGRPDADLQERVSRRFVEDSRQALRGACGLLERLRARYRLGIVSNFYGNLDSILAAEGLAPFFRVVADSELVGAAKPDRKLFLHAADGLGARPEQCVMVGDSVRRDMAGAEVLGMPHIWIDAGRKKLPPCCPSGLRVSRLAEIAALLLEEKAPR